MNKNLREKAAINLLKSNNVEIFLKKFIEYYWINMYNNNIVFYTDDEDNISIEVILQNENVWLNVESLTKLFKIDRIGITKHINNIYKDEELEENSTCAKIAQVQIEGGRRVTRK